MNTLLLLAALSSQITFNTTQQGDVYTIIPEVTLTQSCLCRERRSIVATLVAAGSKAIDVKDKREAKTSRFALINQMIFF